jgi:ABC-type oligopeptide transport system ATPase subunit|tara:strand:- start:908 stop:1075 length:168 start_codon:yes stop_codon:yes gene_type:complete
MAKVVVSIPEPQQEYDVSNQRQILEALDTLKNQLNFSFQQDLKNEEDAKEWFLGG